MADPQITTAIDRLSRPPRGAGDATTSAAPAAPSAEARLGLRFVPRDRVIDTLTGQRAIVQSGRRAQSTGRGVFVVQLADGTLTHRDERELERDQPPAPAPAK